MLISAIGGDGMVDSYGELVRQARDAKNISAKQLSEKLNVSAPFITDIEKNRRLPSLQNQNKIKKLLASKQFPETLFDDFAAAGNDDTRMIYPAISTCSDMVFVCLSPFSRWILWPFSSKPLNGRRDYRRQLLRGICHGEKHG